MNPSKISAVALMFIAGVANAAQFNSIQELVQAQVDYHNNVFIESFPQTEIVIPPPTQMINGSIPWTGKWRFKSLDKEIKCLAQNIYFESWQEEVRGQIAVALVTINRLKSGLYADSICKVVWQHTRNKRGKRVAQFSWTLDGRSDKPKNVDAWERSVQLAKQALANKSLNNLEDFTSGATFYHAVYVSPKWRNNLELVVQIGLHIFYRDPKQDVDFTM